MKDMTELEEYQEWVSSTSAQMGLPWATLGVVSEAGEVSGEVEKFIRKGGDPLHIDEDTMYKLVDEMGDVMWFLAEMCNELGVTLDDVIGHNIHKINKRIAQRDE